MRRLKYQYHRLLEKLFQILEDNVTQKSAFNFIAKQVKKCEEMQFVGFRFSTSGLAKIFTILGFYKRPGYFPFAHISCDYVPSSYEITIEWLLVSFTLHD